MLRLILSVLTAVAMVNAGCSKMDTRNETVLYGTWVNKNNPTDTLQFMLVNGKNIMRYNPTLDPNGKRDSIAYSYTNGKLAAAVPGNGQPLKTVDSFNWEEQNKSFDILGYQLYLLLSSTTTHFTYKKL